jgi:hypothetical protein
MASSASHAQLIAEDDGYDDEPSLGSVANNESR